MALMPEVFDESDLLRAELQPRKREILGIAWSMNRLPQIFRIWRTIPDLSDLL